MKNIKSIIYTVRVLCFAFLFISFSSNSIFGQQENIDPSSQILPPSPTASALGKYGDIPVGLNTGTPNISIPLSTLQGDGINVPISLSYHGSGVKVDEISSWVGLNWSLNAGGVITRTVRGIPDESFHGFMNLGSNFPYPFDITNQEHYNFLRGVVEWGTHDSQPDLFNFNVGGYSGKFVFDNDGNIRTIPHQNLIIERINNGGDEYWLLTTPDGNIYKFGTDEATEKSKTQTTWINSNCGSYNYDAAVPTSWFLKEITNPNTEEVITFSYDSHRIQYELNYNERFSFPLQGSGGYEYELCSTAPYTLCQTVTSKIDEGVHLSSIQSSFGTVDFISDNNRPDLTIFEGDNRLTEIQFKGITGQNLKSFIFEQNFWTAIEDNVSENLKSKKRMYLSTLTEKGSDGSLNPPHIFNYNNGNLLPPRLSYAQDHWGFYNGHDNNSNFTPGLEDINATYEHNLVGGNREPDSDYSNYGMLTNITYPTGGSSDLVFEEHDIGICEEQEIREEVYENAIAIWSHPNNSPPQPYSTIRTFTIDQVQDVRIVYDLIMTGCGPAAKVELRSVGSNNVIKSWGGSSTSCPAIIQGTEHVPLVPGTYEIEARVENGAPNQSNSNNSDYNNPIYQNGEEANIRVFYTRGLGIEWITNQPIGGIRVKQVRTNDNNGNTSIKEYKYTTLIEPENCDSLSSGQLLIRKPNYVSLVETTVGFPPSLEPLVLVNCLYVTCRALVAQSSSYNHLSSSTGNFIAYEEVSVLEGEAGQNGKTYNKFSIEKDLLPEFDINLTTIQNEEAYSNFLLQTRGTGMGWRTGHLLEQKVFNSEGMLLKETINNYNFDSPEHQYFIKAIVAKKFFNIPCENGIASENFSDLYGLLFYDVISQWFFLESSTTTEYNEQGQNPLESTTSYIYSPEHLNPTTITSTAPGVGTETINQYAHDVPSSYPLKNEMINRGMTGVVLESNTTGTITSGNKTEYTLVDNKILPEHFHQVRGTSGMTFMGSFEYTDSDHYPDRYQSDFEPIPQEYTWHTSGTAKEGLLEQKKFANWTWGYDYYNDTRLIKRMSQVDGTYATYDYDGFQRLDEIIQFGVGGTEKSNTSIVYQIGNDNSITETTNFGDAPSQVSTKLFDGIGRTLSTSVNGLLQEQYIYDEFGRVDQKMYLPGSFTRLTYEPSPLNRIKSETFPDNNSVQYEYDAENSLYKSTVIDENLNPSIALTDGYGRTIESVDALDNVTTYSYDNFGNIGTVLPPNFAETQEKYDYTYDQYNRLITKEIPSGGTHEFRYNAKDELIASQTGNEWIGTTYDFYGRPCETGRILADPTNNGNISFDEVYTKTYYDDYLGMNTKPEFTNYLSPDGNAITSIGKVVGTKVKVLDLGSAPNDWIYTTTAYDEFGRSFKTNSSNLLDGNDLVVSDLNLADLPKGITRTHNINSGDDTQTIQENFTYDNFLRPYTHRHGLNGADQVLLSLSHHNGIGQLISKKIGQADGINGFLQNIDYAYNKRGWLTHINGVNMTGQDTSIPICDDGIPPPPCGEKCDYLVEFSFQGDDAIIDIIYGKLASNNTYNSTSAALNYPYTPINNDFPDLENDLIAWMFAEGIPNQGVEVEYANGIYTLNIYQTDAKFQFLETFQFSLGQGHFESSCRPSSQVCDYSVYVPASINDNVTNITYDNLTIPLNYPYNSAPSTGLSALVADLTAWLNAENIPHQGVSIFNSGDVLILSIYQTNIEFQTITTDAIGVRAFNQENCSIQNTPIDDDICIRCIDEGYECDRCPYTQAPDKCTQCFDAGYDDCEQCPFTVKLIRPTSIKVEYNHPALTSSDLLSNASLVRVTERSYRTLYNDQVIATHKTLNTVVGEGNISDAPLTHVMEIELGDQWINEVTLDAVKGNIQNLLMAEIESAGIDELAKQLAFAEAVIEIAASNWGGTSAKLDDDGGGGQTPTQGPPNIINPDMFSMQLTYADGHAMVNSPIQKNGNISGMIWQTPGRNTQSYSLEYDEINRLKNAYHQDVISGGQLSTDNKYGVEITYDKVGNINTLNRRGVIDICPTPTPSFEYGAMDALSYNYISKPEGKPTNRLQSIEEFANIDHGFKSEGGEYTYDDFGNMTTDAKTGANITYNHLNLPESITISGEGTINFVYDAAGIKLKKIVSGNDEYIMHYIGGIEYKNSEIESIQHAEGRITFTESENKDTGEKELEPLYEYFLKDHLGNVRVTLADKDGDGYIEPFNVNPNEVSAGGGDDGPSVDLTNTDVLQETHYYPFGMTMEGEWQNIVGDSENKYLYNGKELNTDFDLNWSDYGARYYDAAIGRWNGIDPLAEKYPSFTPYHYTANNPILFVDYDGRDFGIRIDEKSKTITISQTFYTGGDKEVINALKKVKEDFEGVNGLYGLETKDGTYAINYDINIDESTEKGEVEKAYNDDEGNSLFIGGVSIMEEMRGTQGYTKDGGDNMVVKKQEDNKELQDKVTKHEVLHSQGVGHGIMGKRGAFINEKTIATTLRYSKSRGKSRIKVKGSKRRWMFFKKGKVKVVAHSRKRLKGRVKKLK